MRTPVLTTDSQESNAQPSASLVRSLKFRIISIALISMAGLAVFIANVVNDSDSNAKLLDSIEHVSYPTQAHMIEAVHTLESIQRDLENAVTTGDIDTANATGALAVKFIAHVEAVKKISPTAEFVSVNDKFEEYYNDSLELALTLIDPSNSIAELKRRGKVNNEHYQSLLTRLNNIHQASNEHFTYSIADATSRANATKKFALYGGSIILVIVMAIAIVTANSIIQRINKMISKLKRLASDDSDLKVRLDVSGQDEMSELSRLFNQIIAKLENTSRTAAEHITHIANTDELSGLHNRRYLIKWLSERTEDRQPNDHFSVLFIDLDDFKPVNDNYGHDIGDALIRGVAVRLTQFFNSNFPKHLIANSSREPTPICRLGGDEFMLVLPNLSDHAQLSNLLQELIEIICAPFELQGNQCRVGISVGVSRFPFDAQNCSGLLDRADLAMYEAKNKGKRQFVFYEQTLENDRSFESALLESLKSPETYNEFELHYQPKFMISDKRLVGGEALLRWTSPQHGNVSPGSFIPLAESKNLIDGIDKWVLDNACLQLHRWQLAGMDATTIAINFSARTLNMPNLAERVVSTLKKYDLDPHLLQLEITESAVLELNDTLSDTILRLRNYGITVALDDFGAGHSSLQVLTNNQVDLLKLDKSLMDDIATSHRSQIIVQAIVALATGLGVEVLAEGIETVQQHNYLQSLGNIQAQGYFYAHPLPEHEFTERYLSPRYGAAANAG